VTGVRLPEFSLNRIRRPPCVIPVRSSLW
jgi:hypothetical protein